MPVTISDTSPIRCLAHLELLDALSLLYGEVLIPPAVADELEHPRRTFSPVNVSAYSFLRIEAMTDARQVEQLRAFLDPGESEALVLADQLTADTLLVDDALAREEARRMGIGTMGTAGILIRAKDAGMIAAVTPLLDRLQAELRFFVSPALRRQVRRLAGE